MRSIAAASGRGFGGGGGLGSGGVGAEALAAGLSRAAAKLAEKQPPTPQLRATSPQRRASPPAPAKEVRFAEEDPSEKEEKGKGGEENKVKVPLASTSYPPPNPPSSSSSVLSEALQPLVSAAGEAASRTLREVPARLARGAAGFARDLLPPPSLLPFRVPSAFSGASPTAPQQGFIARARAEGIIGLAADARSAAAQGSIRAIALAQPWLEGGLVVAAAAWRKAEDAFAAAVSAIGEGEGESDSEEEEKEGEGEGEQLEKQRKQPSRASAASASAAVAPQQQENEQEQEQQPPPLSFPTLEKVAGLAFGLSLLWLVLGIPPAALFGVSCVFISHSLARGALRFARLRSGGGWAGGRMRRVARRIRRERSRAALLKQQQVGGGGIGGGGASSSAVAKEK